MSNSITCSFSESARWELVEMRVAKIPKRRGSYRTIYMPDPEEKRALRALLGPIEQKSANADQAGVSHGFRRGRSPVTNAQAHVGRRFTLCMDLKDFFDTVTEDKLRGRLSKEEIAQVIVDGAARQGLPTSPAVANLAAVPMDKAILKLAKKQGWDIVYTRYADDLSLSFDDPEIAEPLQHGVEAIVKRSGFLVNDRKTQLLDARDGRRMITGVAVDSKGIHPPRSVKRRLRAALHQGNIDQARGLAEWARLKQPRDRSRGVGGRTRKEIRAEVKAVSKIWKVRMTRARLDALREKPEEWITLDIVITGDPVYMLGMSTLTTGWTSCMRHPNGQYRRGTVFWTLLPGTRVAALLSNSTTVVGGVERRTMRARTLVHTMRDGSVWHDRVYGNPGDTDVLINALHAQGILRVEKHTRLGTKVQGNVDAELLRGHRPHLDSLIIGTGRLPSTGENVVFAKTN